MGRPRKPDQYLVAIDEEIQQSASQIADLQDEIRHLERSIESLQRMRNRIYPPKKADT